MSVESRDLAAHRSARLVLYGGVVLVVVGVVALFAGYRGLATNDLVEAQLPFIISGGMVGVTLVVSGVVAIALHTYLRSQADFRQELTDVVAGIADMADAVSRAAIHNSRELTANGAANGADTAVIITSGGATFHRPECRLIGRAKAPRPVPRAELDDGLTPCRVCKP